MLKSCRLHNLIIDMIINYTTKHVRLLHKCLSIFTSDIHRVWIGDRLSESAAEPVRSKVCQPSRRHILLWPRQILPPRVLDGPVVHAGTFPRTRFSPTAAASGYEQYLKRNVSADHSDPLIKTLTGRCVGHQLPSWHCVIFLNFCPYGIGKNCYRDSKKVFVSRLVYLLILLFGD